MPQVIEVRKVNPMHGIDELVGEAENEATARFVMEQLAPAAMIIGWQLYARVVNRE